MTDPKLLARLILPQRALYTELAGLAALTVAMPFLEVASVASMGLVIYLLQSPGAKFSGIAGKLTGMIGGGLNRILFAALAMAILFLLKSIVTLVQGYLVQIYSRDFQRNLATRLLRGYLAMPFDFYTRNNTVVMIQNVTTQSQQLVEGVVQNAIVMVSEGLVLLPLLALLVYVDPPASLVLITAFILAFVCLRIFVARHTGPIRRQREEATGRVLKLAQAALSGIREVSLGDGGAYLLAQFEEAATIYARASGNTYLFNVVPRVVFENMAVVSLLSIIVIGGVLHGESNLAVIAVFAAASYRILPSLGRVQSAWFHVSYSLPGFLKLAPILTEVMARAAPARAIAAEPFRELDVAGLGYAYHGKSEPVVADLTLKISRGEMLGLVGPSGVGKTTLVNLLVGLLQPQSGTITLNGKLLSGHAELGLLRAQAAYVPQSVFIADDTLLNNVTLGTPGDAICRERLASALAISQLDQVVGNLPQKLETPLGEKGVRLSGGEAQRVGIARALYLDRPFLILDEATAALDRGTEARLMQAIHQRRADLCVLVVSHRDTALLNCDRVYRLEAGRLRPEAQNAAAAGRP